MNNKKVIDNFFWRFLERCGAQGVTLVVSIILARILNPEAYGVVALITVITSILQVFVDSGLGTALIQKKDADDLDFSSVFYFNFVVCMVLYGIMFFGAPLVAAFYEKPELTALTRVASLSLVISGVKNIQQAYVSRHLMFKRFFFATLGGTIGAAFIGIWMAYKGYGAWAIVVQNLFNKTVDTVILWITVKWKPKKMFSWERLKSLLSYGWKLLVSSLIDKVYEELRQLVIGKMYSSADLAFYNKGQHFPGAVVNNVNTSIDSVLLPVMSQKQDDVDAVRSMTRRSIRVGTYIMAPLMVGLAAISPILIPFLLSDKWTNAVIFMQVFCFTYMLHPIQTANLNAIKAMGRSELFLKLDIIKKVIGFSILIGTMWFGVKAIAYGMLAASFINQIVNSWPNHKLLKYNYFEQLKDILPSLLLALVMGSVIYCYGFLELHSALILVLQVLTAVVIYVGGSVLLRIDSFYYILTALKKYTKKGKAKG